MILAISSITAVPEPKKNVHREKTLISSLYTAVRIDGTKGPLQQKNGNCKSDLVGRQFLIHRIVVVPQQNITVWNWDVLRSKMIFFRPLLPGSSVPAREPMTFLTRIDSENNETMLLHQTISFNWPPSPSHALASKLNCLLEKSRWNTAQNAHLSTHSLGAKKILVPEKFLSIFISNRHGGNFRKIGCFEILPERSFWKHCIFNIAAVLLRSVAADQCPRRILVKGRRQVRSIKFFSRSPIQASTGLWEELVPPRSRWAPPKTGRETK